MLTPQRTVQYPLTQESLTFISSAAGRPYRPTQAAPRDPRSLPKGCLPSHEMAVGLLVAVGVFLPTQLAIMICIAFGEVLTEPLVALDVIRSQVAVLFGIQSVEATHHIVPVGLILAVGPRVVPHIGRIGL